MSPVLGSRFYVLGARMRERITFVQKLHCVREL